jgi:hypothetical protein
VSPPGHDLQEGNMNRRRFLGVGLALVAASMFFRPGAGAREKVPGPPAGTKAVEVADKLQRAISNDREIRAALSTVLEFVADKADLPIVIDLEAFKAEENAQAEPEQQEVRLQKLTGVTVATTLRLVLGQINATYVIRCDHIEIIPRTRLALELNPPAAGGPDEAQRVFAFPLVHGAWDGKSLANALNDLATQSGKPILLAPYVGEKGQAKITAHFTNVSLDNAVRLVAEMAELKVVEAGNVLFVTTPDRAAELQAEQKERRRAAQPTKPTAAEEQYRKQLDEAREQLERYQRELQRQPKPTAPGPIRGGKPGTDPRSSQLIQAAAVYATLLAADIKPEPADVKGTPTATSLAAKLAQRVSIDKPMDGPLGEILTHLSDRFDLPILIDPQIQRLAGGMARSNGGTEKALAALVATVAALQGPDQPVKLPKVMRVRLETVLRNVLDQADLTYLVYPDHIKVTSQLLALAETGQIKPPAPGSPDDSDQLLRPDQMLRARPLAQRALVNAAIREKPLGAALDEIADSTGATIILAPQASEKARVAVSARFANVPVESAVRILAEQCDLKVVSTANALYVTTPERAEAWQEEDDARKPPPPAGGGMGGLGGAGALGIAGGGMGQLGALGIGGGALGLAGGGAGGALGLAGGGALGFAGGMAGGGAVGVAHPDVKARLSEIEEQLKGLDEIKKKMQALTTAVEAMGKKPAKRENE